MCVQWGLEHMGLPDLTYFEFWSSRQVRLVVIGSRLNRGKWQPHVCAMGIGRMGCASFVIGAKQLARIMNMEGAEYFIGF